MSKRKSTTSTSSGAKTTRKAPPKPVTKSSTTTVKAKPRKSSTRSRSLNVSVTAEQRFRMIQEAAYYNALSGNCQDDIENWLRAEAEIDSRILGN